MSDPRAEIAHERRRQVQVRRALESGIASGMRAPGDFYLACTDYLAFALERLYRQDMQIHALLSERIPATDTAAHGQLDRLAEQQEAGRHAIEALRIDAARYREGARSGVSGFEGACRNFANQFNRVAAPRRNPFEAYTDELFSHEDWVRIAGTTPESLAREQELFEHVRRTAPEGADPDAMLAGH